MIEFNERDDGAVIVGRKGGDFLGVIEKNSENKMIYTSMGNTSLDGGEMLVIATALLGKTSCTTQIKNCAGEEFGVTIRLATE